MSLTQEARKQYQQRTYQAKWVLARKYIQSRNLYPYKGLPIALRVVSKGQ